MENKFTKFTSIEKFSDAWAQMIRQGRQHLTVRPKIKLHGTNAGVRIVDGVVTAQKRSSDITPMADNAGFATFVYTVEWKKDRNCIINGEWAGPGVQKSDAVSLIEKKHFFVFSIQVDDQMIIEPELIKEYLPIHPLIKILPWAGEPFDLNTSNVEGARVYGASLQEQVAAIGNEDPYVKEQFNVSGAGEGLVVAPYDASGIVPNEVYRTFVFKVKSEAHSVQKTKSVSPQIEIPSSVYEFADVFVTPARCEQMVNEHLEGNYDSKGISTFLKAINEDIIKESRNEIAEMGLDWKSVAKVVNSRAVNWFKSANNL